MKGGGSSLVIGLITLVIIGGMVVYRWHATPGGAAVLPKGSAAPDVETTTLDGQRWRLSEQRGKVVVLDFWATWCGPCVAAMPQMKKIYERFHANPDFLMVGVSLDPEPQKVRTFVQNQQIAWLQLQEEGQDWSNSFARAYQVNGIPSTWVIGRAGQVLGRDLEPRQLEALITKALESRS